MKKKTRHGGKRTPWIPPPTTEVFPPGPPKLRRGPKFMAEKNPERLAMIKMMLRRGDSTTTVGRSLKCGHGLLTKLRREIEAENQQTERSDCREGRA